LRINLEGSQADKLFYAPLMIRKRIKLSDQGGFNFYRPLGTKFMATITPDTLFIINNHFFIE